MLIIPLDHQFSVQQVFALWNWDCFKVWNFLIFEVVKLCRMRNILQSLWCRYNSIPLRGTQLSILSFLYFLLNRKFLIHIFFGKITIWQKLHFTSSKNLIKLRQEQHSNSNMVIMLIAVHILNSYHFFLKGCLLTKFSSETHF